MVLRPMLVNSSAQEAAGSALAPTPGWEDVTIQLCLSEAVGGYLTPDSWVAVYETAPKPGANVTRSCSVQHTAVVPGTAMTALLLPRVKVVSVVLGSNTQSTNPGIASVLADPANSALLSSGAVAVTFQVTNTEAKQLITDAQVELPYLALLPTG